RQKIDPPPLVCGDGNDLDAAIRELPMLLDGTGCVDENAGPCGKLWLKQRKCIGQGSLRAKHHAQGSMLAFGTLPDSFVRRNAYGKLRIIDAGGICTDQD